MSFTYSHLGVAAGVLLCALAAQGQHGRYPVPVPEEPAPAGTAATKPFPYTDAVRANNIGVALMNRRLYAEALGKFQTACVLDPESDTGCLNSGIALLNMLHYDDARRILEKSAERDPQNPRVWFNLALLERAAGNSEAAMADFQATLDHERRISDSLGGRSVGRGSLPRANKGTSRQMSFQFAAPRPPAVA